MKRTLLVFSLILMFVGFTLFYIYLIPYGLLLDGIGSLIFIYAIFAKEEEPYPRRFASREKYLKALHQEDYRCGSCLFLGSWDANGMKK